MATRARGDGDGAQVALPVSEVDSLRVKKLSPTRTVLAVIGAVGGVGFLVAVSGGLYGDEP